jgi:hypothetical protein
MQCIKHNITAFAHESVMECGCFLFVVNFNFTMSGKVVLTYFNGRGKMESIRWLLAVAGVEVSRLNKYKTNVAVGCLQDLHFQVDLP